MVLLACADPGVGAEQPAFAVARSGTTYTGLSAAPASRNVFALQGGDAGVWVGTCDSVATAPAGCVVTAAAGASGALTATLLGAVWLPAGPATQ